MPGRSFPCKHKKARCLQSMQAVRLLRRALKKVGAEAHRPLGTGGSVDGEHGARDIG